MNTQKTKQYSQIFDIGIDEDVIAQIGEDISDAKALDSAINLLTEINYAYRPIKKEWADEYPEKDKNI